MLQWPRFVLKHLLGISLAWRSTGDTTGAIDSAFVFFLDALAFDDEGLADVREIQAGTLSR